MLLRFTLVQATPRRDDGDVLLDPHSIIGMLLDEVTFEKGPVCRIAKVQCSGGMRFVVYDDERDAMKRWADGAGEMIDDPESQDQAAGDDTP